MRDPRVVLGKGHEQENKRACFGSLSNGKSTLGIRYRDHSPLSTALTCTLAVPLLVVGRPASVFPHM